MGRAKIPTDSTDVDFGCTLGFYSWNVPENRVYGDDVVADIFGLTAHGLAAGAPIEMVIRYIDDGDKQRAARTIHDAIISGLPHRAEYGITHPNGRKLRVVANGRCLRDAEGVPSIYSGTVAPLSMSAASPTADPLESHCRAARGIARERRHALAARYLSSALNVIGAQGDKCRQPTSSACPSTP